MSLAAQFFTLFKGSNLAYGRYRVSGVKDGLKVQGEGDTVRGQVTEALWQKHLDGEQGLGIITINEESECYWGAIDVDSYDGLDHSALAQRLAAEKLPLVLARSKSGGAHIFVFFVEPVAAAMVRAKLTEISAHLGYGQSEIFPKQNKVLVKEGDLGNWLNMPYFDATKTVRYSFNDLGKALKDAQQFIDLANKTKVSWEFFSLLALAMPDDVLPGGPPCLQRLALQGIPQGGRNKTLFNMALYAHKVNPETEEWKKRVREYNEKFLKPSLSPLEVDKIIKHVEKKDYNYQCSEHPLKPFCNHMLCKQREFGVGMSGAVPIITSLSKLCTSPAVWFADLDTLGKVQLGTADLINQNGFRMQCAEQLNRIFPFLDASTWHKITSTAMSNATLIDTPIELSLNGYIEQELQEFFRLSPADKKEDVLRGHSYYVNNCYWFRLVDFMLFLEKKKSKLVQNQVVVFLKELKAENVQWKLPPNDRWARVWGFKMPAHGNAPLPLPPIPNAAY